MSNSIDLKKATRIKYTGTFMKMTALCPSMT